MTVVNPKSISGINSITTGSGSDNLLTIHTSDASSTERVRINSSGDVIVGSGITVSPDGDIFTTGVTTATTFSGAFSGSGANITALNASNIASGTVPTARLGSGTASSSTFLRGDSTFQTVNTDLVSDTSPQLGGDLASNGNDIIFADNDKAIFGTGSDLKIYHNGTHNYFLNSNGDYVFDTGSSELARLTSSGNFGVGTNNPTSKIDIHCGSDNTAMQITSTDAGAYLTAIDNTGAGSFGHQGTDTVITCDAGGSVANSAISFQIDYNVERMRIQNNGNVTISDGDLVIGTNGHGIDFSAAGNVGGMTSELLDDYEEGTWIPDARDGSLSYERANYTKIGRMVYLSAYVYNFSDNSTNDSVTIQSLPFTPSVISVAVGSVMYNFVSDTDNTTVYMASTGLVFYGGVSGGYDQVRYNELNGNSSFYFQAAYFAS